MCILFYSFGKMALQEILMKAEKLQHLYKINKTML